MTQKSKNVPLLIPLFDTHTNTHTHTQYIYYLSINMKKYMKYYNTNTIHASQKISSKNTLSSDHFGITEESNQSE